MSDAQVTIADIPLTPVALTGLERLGHASTFTLELISPEPVEPRAVLGQPAALLLTSAFGERVVHGVVTDFVVVGTSQSAPSRRYELTLRSAFGLLSLRVDRARSST